MSVNIDWSKLSPLLAVKWTEKLNEKLEGIVSSFAGTSGPGSISVLRVDSLSLGSVPPSIEVIALEDAPAATSGTPFGSKAANVPSTPSHAAATRGLEATDILGTVFGPAGILVKLNVIYQGDASICLHVEMSLDVPVQKFASYPVTVRLSEMYLDATLVLILRPLDRPAATPALSHTANLAIGNPPLGGLSDVSLPSLGADRTSVPSSSFASGTPNGPPAVHASSGLGKEAPSAAPDLPAWQATVFVQQARHKPLRSLRFTTMLGNEGTTDTAAVVDDDVLGPFIVGEILGVVDALLVEPNALTIDLPSMPLPAFLS